MRAPSGSSVVAANIPEMFELVNFIVIEVNDLQGQRTFARGHGLGESQSCA